jgi:hypothetical protein
LFRFISCSPWLVNSPSQFGALYASADTARLYRA